MKKVFVCLMILAAVSLVVCGCQKEEKTAEEEVKAAVEAPAAKDAPKDHPAH